MIQMVKRTLRKIIKGQKGQALPIVLILLVIGGLLIVPTLNYASTSLKGHQVVEMDTLELYSADSGVEDAIYWLPQLETGNSTEPWIWDGSNWTRNSYDINERGVNVTVSNVSAGYTKAYKITSTATSGDGGNATIEAYIKVTGFLYNSITTNGNVTINSGSVVNGTVQLPDEENLVNNGEINGDNIIEPMEWPTAENISAFYWEDVKDLEPPFPYTHPMDIAGINTTIEALYRDGPLDIYNSVNTPATLMLNGTVYVTDDLDIGKTNQNFTLNLNGQTIYCDSNIGQGGTAGIGKRCTITGSGCIIARGGHRF